VASRYSKCNSTEAGEGRPVEITTVKASITALIEEEILLPQQGSMTRLQEKLAAREFVVSVELDPPKGLNPSKIMEGAVLLQKAGVDCINIADSPMARSEERRVGR